MMDRLCELIELEWDLRGYTVFDDRYRDCGDYGEDYRLIGAVEVMLDARDDDFDKEERCIRQIDR